MNDSGAVTTTNPDTGPPSQSGRKLRKNVILAFLSLSTFMIFLDGTVVNTALPAIARDFGANNSILQWIVKRARSGARAEETPIGWIPRYDDIEWAGLDFSKEQWDQVMHIDHETWKEQTEQHEELFLQLGDRLPRELALEREMLARRLQAT